MNTSKTVNRVLAVSGAFRILFLTLTFLVFVSSQAKAVNPPTQVAAVAVSSTSARITWRNPSGTLQAIQIYQSRDGGAYTLGENVPATATSAVRDGLSAGSDYCFKVRVQAGGQWSAFSDPACLPPVPPPTSVGAAVVDSTSARVTWSNPAGGVDAIQIYDSRDGGGFSLGENVPATLQAAVRSGLITGSTYCFKVRVQKAGRWSEFSSTQGCVTLELPPVSVPGPVNASALSSTSARVSWTNPAGGIEEIQIYQSRNGGAFDFAENVPPDRTSAIRDGLDPGVPYCFKVRVKIGGRWSSLSEAACVVQPPTPAPTAVTATAVDYSSARVRWNNPSEGIEAIQIYESRDGGGFGFGENVPPSLDSAVRTGLVPGALYCFKVRVQIAGRWSALSATEGCVTLELPPVGAPGTVSASVVSPASARVSWTNPAGVIEEIQIYQSWNGGAFDFAENVPPDRTSAIRDGLDPGVQYCFKVRVKMGGRWSSLSEAACVLQPQVPAPSGVTAVSLDYTAAQVRWTNPPGTIQAIQIYDSRDEVNFTFGENVPETLEAAMRTDLVPGGAYCFKVRVRIDGLWSALSSSQGCVTLSAPKAPVQVSPGDGATGVPHRATLDWNPVTASTGYDYEVYKGSALVFSNAGGPIASTSVELSFDYNTTYRWRVRARVIQSNPWSAYWTFRTVPPPGPPQQLTPVHGSSGLGLSVQLDWAVLSGATGYDYEVYEDGKLFAKNESGPVSATRVTISAHKSRTYKWRVRGRVIPQDNPWSEFWRFDTLPSIPPPVTVSPANGSMGVITPVTLVWSPVPGADHYDVEGYEDGAFSIEELAVPDVSVAVETWATVTIDWRVRAHTASGYTEWSDFSRFTTAPAPLGVCAELVNPAEESLYPVGSPVVLEADIFIDDPDGNYSGEPGDAVAAVQFFANGSLIGQVAAPPYSIAWTPPLTGDVALSLKTVTRAGAVVPSEETVTIAITPPSSAPQITLQPVSQLIPGGNSANFLVAATGPGLLSYQWQKLTRFGFESGASLQWLDIAGANQPAFPLTAVSRADESWYRCLVTSGTLATISDEAELIVVSPILVSLKGVNPGDALAFGTPVTLYAEILGGEADAFLSLTKFEFYDGSVKIGEATPTLPGITSAAFSIGGHDLRVRPIGGGLAFSDSPSIPIRVASPSTEKIELSLEGKGSGAPSLKFTSLIGATYRIEASRDLESWSILTELPGSGSLTYWTDPDGQYESRRFYRVRTR